MSVLKYFQLGNPMLPKPDGLLSTAVSSSSIAAANKEVKQLLDKADNLALLDRTAYRTVDVTSRG